MSKIAGCLVVVFVFPPPTFGAKSDMGKSGEFGFRVDFDPSVTTSAKSRFSQPMLGLLKSYSQSNSVVLLSEARERLNFVFTAIVVTLE